MFPELTRDDVFRIETARLWLRWPRAADVPAFARLAADADVAKMTACLQPPFGVGEAQDFIIGARRVNVAGEGTVLAVAPRDDPAAFLGIVGVQAAGPDSLALGYWLGRPYWGQGLMCEAMSAVLDMAFVLSKATGIETPAPPPGSAAATVLARAGFPPAGADGRCCIGRRDWLGLRAGAADRIARPQTAA